MIEDQLLLLKHALSPMIAWWWGYLQLWNLFDIGKDAGGPPKKKD